MSEARPHPTQAALHAYLDYDPDTGIFIWRPRKKARGWRPDRFGKRAGGFNGTYFKIAFFGTAYLAHRLAWIYVHGDNLASDLKIDHVNGDPTDNRLVNLRLASHQQNMGNCRKYRNNTSGYKGVSYSKSRKKWVAQIGRCRGAHSFLGHFNTREEAHQAYLNAAQERFGEFARAT